MQSIGSGGMMRIDRTFTNTFLFLSGIFIGLSVLVKAGITYIEYVSVTPLWEVFMITDALLVTGVVFWKCISPMIDLVREDAERAEKYRDG